MTKRTKTNYIVIHCAATPPHMDIGAKEIKQWHLQRGFQDIGYHEVIRRDGKIDHGREPDEVGAHVKGHNSESVGLCLVGGVDKKNRPENNFTPEQFKTLKRLLRFYMAKYPKAMIIGHRDLDSGKACPSFDVQDWLREEHF